MDIKVITKEQARAYSPLTLAFLGDSYYELMVRRKITLEHNMSANKLHIAAVKKVRASFQAAACEKIAELLTVEEAEIFRRGRNAGGAVPRSASPAEYRKATALEALLGWLLLIGENTRAEELFEVIYNSEKK
ncbi:MAG: ribonuclease III [Oscillospiraceae bacterium]|jgi:ribonuclease-3 family protein|nr:ribonuclease III [Oscillospiraceae bacterium]